MNLRDMSPAPDDPMEALFGFHRRLERDLAALGRLPPHLESFGLDVAASAAAAGLLHGLGTAAALHHAQEEHELMPLLERRIARPGERDAFRALRQGIEADHREIELLWRSLRRPLKAIGEGLARRLPVDEIQYFRAIWTTHISAEEASLHLLALRHLLPGDRTALAQRIRARRERGLRAA
jgi:pyridoxamine 5'-phosphate oxidase